METRPAYRPEIDGLRALAVLAVILFHAGCPGLGGGFLGVDVFFVISGYLITGVLIADLHDDAFSLARFCQRRIRRILPALVVTMLACIPFALWGMLPDDLENFGQSLVATASFGNNILLTLTSGYFALENDFKPLLHTWSLGVEEHYYLAIPLVLLFAFRMDRRRGALLATLAITAGSLLACLWLSRRAPAANFYLVFSRAWELGAGGLAILAEPTVRRRLAARPILAELLAWAGLAAIGASLILLGPDAALPSWPSLAPVLGSCALLAGASAGRGLGRLLATAPLRPVGLISYSAYLWHQPVFAFARIFSLSQPPLALMLGLIPPILGLAWLSWRYVEQPFRYGWSFPRTAVLAGVGSALALTAGLSMYFTSGFLALRPELASSGQDLAGRQNAAYNQGPLRFSNLPLNGSPHPRVMVLGNSYARDFINMGLETGWLKPQSLSYATAEDCRVSPAAANILPHADLVIIGNSFTPPGLACLEALTSLARAQAKGKVLILGTKNFGWNNNAVMLLPADRRYAFRTLPLPDFRQANRLARDEFGESYLDLLGKLSDSDGRIPVFTPDHKLISQDRSHLTQAGARYVGKILFADPRLQANLQPGAPPDPEIRRPAG